MTDLRLRELERGMAQGDAQAAEQWTAEWVRAGNERPRAGLVRVLADAFQPHHFVTPCCQEPVAIGPSVMDPASFTHRVAFYCLQCRDHGGRWWPFPRPIKARQITQRIGQAVYSMHVMVAPRLVAHPKGRDPGGMLDPTQLAPFPTKVLARLFAGAYECSEQTVFTLDSYLNAPFGWVANKRRMTR